jgi:hypothetical protein
LRDTGSETTEGEGQTMTWAKAVEAMRCGRFVRRPHWGKHDLIRFTDDQVLFPNNSEKRSVLYIEENKTVNFDFILNDVCADDWVIFERIWNEDNRKWEVMP